MTNLTIIYKAVDTLIPYVNNARTHDEKQITQIASSIKEFGFNNPILLDGDNGVIAGHGRLLAAQKLGMKQVPCVELKHLTPVQKKAYILADNKIALNSDWDTDLLKIEIDGLRDEDFDLSVVGFDESEIESLFNDADFDPTDEDSQGKLDELTPKWTKCPHCGKIFDYNENKA